MVARRPASAGWRRSACSKSARASSPRPAARATAARSSSSSAPESPARVGRREPITRSERNSERKVSRVRSDDVMSEKETAGDAGPAAGSARGHPLFFFREALAGDAVPGERHRVEPLLGDGLAAPLAGTKAPVVDLGQRGHDLAQQPPVAVAQLEEELARVRGVGLVAEVLDRVVLLVLAVQRALADFVDELPLLLDQALFEVRQSILPHHDLPSRTSVSTKRIR